MDNPQSDPVPTAEGHPVSHEDDMIDGPSSPTVSPQFSAKSPGLSRNSSFSAGSDYDTFPPLERLTVLDILDNFALPQQFEKLQRGISAQKEKVRRSREVIQSRSNHAKERMVEEWRRRVPSAEEQLDRYRQRMRHSVEKLGTRWNDTKAITLREKISFICGVVNIFISGLLMGGYPQYFHIWYTAQLFYLMPVRFFTYHSRGYHYFLADLCYFVNGLIMLSLWVFPESRRLFTSAYCLAFGNNAVAIILWRNSLVFHSFDKVTSLFIHIMPCATLHCIVHLISPELKAERFPSVYAIQNALPGSSNDYATMKAMLAWSSLPYAVWQLSYYFFISIRRREQIRAGRPTSFTWLRRSYAKVWIGKLVLRQPEILQEPMFMMIQYVYAVLTMLPCKLWFSSVHASSSFLFLVFIWSIYNGATYYIDVFGNRFQKELEALKADVAKWQHSPDLVTSPILAPASTVGGDTVEADSGVGSESVEHKHVPTAEIPPLNVGGDGDAQASGFHVGNTGVQQRK